MQSLELPLDRPRPRVASLRGASESLCFSAELVKRLSAVSRRQKATLFVTLLSAWVSLLQRYGGEDDFVLGTSIAERPRTELEDLIGFFVNTLPLRMDLSGDPPFSEVLRRVQRTTLGALAHRDISLGQLIEAANSMTTRPEFGHRHQPIFQVAFVMLNAPMEPPRIPGLEASLLDLDPGAAKVDLTLYVQETLRELKVTCQYSTDIFLPATITGLLRSYESVLEKVARGPISGFPSCR